MQAPTRKTRRLIAKWAMCQLTAVLVWMALPGDIGPNEMALAIAFIPSLVLLLSAFIGGETYSDHSARQNKGRDNV